MSGIPKSKESPGPVVIDVQTAHNDAQQQNIMTQIRSRKPRGRPLLLIIGSLVLVVACVMMLENSRGLVEAPVYITPKKAANNGKFDVNAPPIPKQQSFWESSSSNNDNDNDNVMDMDRKSFIFWGQQANRIQETTQQQEAIHKKGKKKPKKGASSSKKDLQPFPVIDDNDDQVPAGAAGSVVRAADALMCRESVVDYVINATDLKDECDGMKKAFTKHCTDGDTAQSRRRSRRLTTSEKQPNHHDSTSKPQNPVIRMQHNIRRRVRSIRWWWNPRAVIVSMGDDILKEWDHASSQVIERWDYRSNHRRRSRRLVEELPADESGDEIPTTVAGNTTAPIKRTHNKTAPIKRHSLSLPTNMHHLSEKTLGESLMLQQEDKIMASVKAAQNNTNATVVKEAVASAAASSKAVSDTADFVSSVLNDPTSVEARTCCTSILNVFHENCDVDEEEELSDSSLFIAVAVIAMCGMVKSLIRHFQIRCLPEAAGCILVGGKLYYGTNLRLVSVKCAHHTQCHNLVAAGWGLSYFPHHDISFDGNWFLRILVPPIIFEAALSIDKRSFNRHVVPILIYAIMGTLLATALTAFVVHEGSVYFHGHCETIPYIEALTFGALISSIDPIAVLSVLSNMGMTDTDTIYVVIFGESLLNDGIAIVLFDTLKHFLDDNMTVDGDAVVAAAIHFFVVAVGSLLVGLASGICCTVYYWMMHGCQTPLVEVLMFCCWALLPYYICDGIEWSGIVAVVAVGFFMDMYVVGQHHTDETTQGYEREESPSSGNSMNSFNGKGKGLERRRRQIFAKEGHLSAEAKTHIGFVTEIIATMMETCIFAYLGLFLFSSRYHWNFYHTFIAIGGCCVSRAIMIPTLSALANLITKSSQTRSTCAQQLPQQTPEKQDKPAGVVIDKKMQLVLWFAGLRGAMSFALVENIPIYDPVTGEGTALKSELKAMTCACIIFTVFILGGLTFYVMDSLGMAPHGVGDHKPFSLLDKEMEMIGLLSKQKTEDVDGDTGWEGGDETIYPQEVPPPPKSLNVFRQRINQVS
jgi:NhaP-type Na+/H+ or K+/H+ antiporter